MGVREGLNSKMGVGAGVAIAFVAVALIAFLLMAGRSTGVPVDTEPTMAFYSDDDGKTFFKDNIRKIVPFDHNGKQAYRADVFKGPDGNVFVGLLYRHTDMGKKQMNEYLARKTEDPTGKVRSGIEVRGGMEVRKLPGKSWTTSYGETRDILRESMKTPSGASASLVEP